eukprot:scaffold1377_cov126-Cylindrotheca_fusiformis.AAC.5
MTSPRCKKLDKDCLTGSCVVPSIGSKFNGIASRKKGKESCYNRLHGHKRLNGMKDGYEDWKT